MRFSLLILILCVGGVSSMSCRDKAIKRLCMKVFPGVGHAACVATLEEEDCYIFHCLSNYVKCDYRKQGKLGCF